MKWNIAVLLAVLASAAANLPAQCGGGGCGYGMVRAGVCPIRPGDIRGARSRWLRGPEFDAYNGNSGVWPDPDYAYYGDYWDVSNYGISDCALQPSLTVTTPIPQTSVPASQPPPPPTPVMHEYSWPASGGDGATAFAIVLKNGAVQRAIAVWIQDGHLCFVTLDGLGRQLSMDEVDRQNTSRVNIEQKLKLQLPT